MPRQGGARPAATGPSPYETSFGNFKNSAKTEGEQLKLAPEISRYVDRKVQRSVAYFCCHRRDCLTPREAGSVTDLLKSYRTLADHRRAWLSALDARLRGEQP